MNNLKPIPILIKSCEDKQLKQRAQAEYDNYQLALEVLRQYLAAVDFVKAITDIIGPDKEDKALQEVVDSNCQFFDDLKDSSDDMQVMMCKVFKRTLNLFSEN